MKVSGDIVYQPLLTEKATDLKDSQGKYVFKVAKNANKLEIKVAVEEIFGVKVRDVKTITVHGKRRRVGRFPEGKRPNWKKAIVTLGEGDKIDLFEGV